MTAANISYIAIDQFIESIGMVRLSPNDVYFNYADILLENYLLPICPIIEKNHTSKLNIKWLCSNKRDDTYEIVGETALHNKYKKQFYDKEHFGVSYCSKDVSHNLMNVKDIKRIYSVQLNRGPDSKYLLTPLQLANNIKQNLSFFTSLDKKSFNRELLKIVKKYHFKRITKLADIEDCLYIMVFDQYKQFYIGQSRNSVRERIKRHWTANVDDFRRVWVGGKKFSRISVDEFKILDCTRIYICEDYEQILNDNAEDINKELCVTNLAFSPVFEEMNDLSIAERIVINNSTAYYCLSDRLPLPDYRKIYSKAEKKYKCAKNKLSIAQIMHYKKLF